MPKYKLLKNVESAKGGKFLKDEVVEGTPTSLKNFVSVIRKNTWGDNKNDLILGVDIEEVNNSTILTNPSDFKNDLQKSDKEDKTITILSTIGGLVGLYYAYSKKKSILGYVGFFVLGGIAGSILGSIITKIKKPKSDTNKSKELNKPTITQTTSENKPVIESNDASNLDTKMSKIQKIDLIVKNMSDPEQKEMDDFNKKFMSTLSNSELNDWLKISKSFKDNNLKKLGELDDKENFYKLLLKNYKINKTIYDSSIKKYGESFIKLFEEGMKISTNNSNFSNFESSLDLDL